MNINKKLRTQIVEYQKVRFRGNYEFRIAKSEKSIYYHDDKIFNQEFKGSNSEYSKSLFLGNVNHIPYKDRYLLDIAYFDTKKHCFYHLYKSGFKSRKEGTSMIANDNIVLTESEIINLYNALRNLKVIKEYQKNKT